MSSRVPPLALQPSNGNPDANPFKSFRIDRVFKLISHVNYLLYKRGLPCLVQLNLVLRLAVRVLRLARVAAVVLQGQRGHDQVAAGAATDDLGK